MSDLEILITLITVIVGLGLVDLLQSFRQLLHPLVEVRWHWLPLAWAVYALLAVIEQWGHYAAVLQQDIFSNQAAYLLAVVSSFFLYLICSFALPDLDTSNPTDHRSSTSTDKNAGYPNWFEDGIVNLRIFYFSQKHRNQFFGACLLGVLSVGFVGFLRAPDEILYNRMVMATGGGFNVIFAILFGTVLLTRKPWLHYITATLATGLMLLLSLQDTVV